MPQPKKTTGPKNFSQESFGFTLTINCAANIADDLQRSMPGYLAKYNIKEGDIVIDCGAYIGEFTLYAAKAAWKAGKVIAFEPDHGFFKELEKNIALNDLHNVILVEKGVWSKEDRLKFSSGSQSSNLFAGNLEYNTTSYDVLVTSLDSELKKRGIAKVDFIKMDVEGSEIEAVKGARAILERCGPQLAIASYHALNGQKTHIELEKILKNFGYDAETGYPAHLTTYGKSIAHAKYL